MRIGIDARFLTNPQPGGFKTYTENLLQALARVDTENEYFLYIDRTPDVHINLLKNSNFYSRVVTNKFPIVGMPWREQVELARQARKDRVDIFHSPCLTAPLILNCPLVVTVHDMIWAFPEKYSQSSSKSIKRKFMELYNRLVPRYAIEHASAIITVSYAAKKSITEHLEIEEGRIFVTHEAANPIFRQIPGRQHNESVRRKYHLPSNFIFAIGSADPRKNISCLVKAYSLLPKEVRDIYSLLILLTHSFLEHELTGQVEKLNLEDKVRFLKSIPNEDLVLLYNTASLFVFPSLYEGFGLPPLEAMACGVPIIASNNSSIPEIVGDAALLFDAHDADEMSKTISQILSDDSLRTTLSTKGIERAASFSWDKCALETMEVYKSLIRFPKTNKITSSLA